MKTVKLLSLSLLLMAAILFTACSGGSKTPLGITKELCSYLEKGDYETHFKKQLEYLTNEEKDKMTEEQQEKYLQLMMKFYPKEIAERGGFKKIEIREDEKSNDETVYIQVFYQYNNHSPFDEWYTFVKTDYGWRIKKRGNL
jgi:hypothetical protein